MTTIIVIIRMTRLCYPLGKVPINHDIIRNKVNMFSENGLSRPKDNNAYFRSPTHILSITSPPPAFIELYSSDFTKSWEILSSSLSSSSLSYPSSSRSSCSCFPVLAASLFTLRFLHRLLSQHYIIAIIITTTNLKYRNSIQVKFSSAIQKYH